MANTFFPFAKDFYTEIEKRYGKELWFEKEIIRPANDVQQLNDTLARMSDGALDDYVEFVEKTSTLDPKIKVKHGY